MKKGDPSWEEFLKLCVAIQSPASLNHLFDLFLTLEEKEMLKSRYLIIKALVEGNLTQREIANYYKTSISQITRGSNALKLIDPSLKKILKKHFEGS